MSYLVRSKSRNVVIRDGKAITDPVRQVGPKDFVLFINRPKEDAELEIVEQQTRSQNLNPVPMAMDTRSPVVSVSGDLRSAPIPIPRKRKAKVK